MTGGLRAALDQMTYSKSTAHCNGPFRLFLNSGKEITPKSKVRRALLAVLVLSPKQTRGRSTLQDMFWGASDSGKASGSLRSALYQLKRDLTDLGDDIIRANENHVSLSPNNIIVAKANPRDGELLEGMDLSIKGSESFEEWLRDTRISVAYDDAIHPPANPSLIPAPGDPDPVYSIGILPITSPMGAIALEKAANGFLDGLARMILQSTLIALFDLRGEKYSKLENSSHPTLGATLLVRGWVTRSQKSGELTLSILDAVTNSILCTFDPIELPCEDQSAGQINVYEVLLDRIMRTHPCDRPPNLMPWSTLSSLFSLDALAVSKTEAELGHLQQNGGPTVVRCLYLFAQVFKEHEGIGDAPVVEVDDLRQALALIPVSDPLRPLCESLIGYCAHMLLSDNDYSKMLLETAYLRAPRMALNLDHLAVLRMAQGDLAGAERAF